ncbi:hypothetical protein CUM54_06625 [Enterococcus faecalis]|uniref:Lipoprotein n=2 Tax=Enterococcus faecalis TaxID=1351 RepID=R3I6X7_ENTFL|nr:hypothetical protein [Enterococcus faecalis]APC56115.1 hypothetical protein BMT03_07735 [Enterococcus faecalis]EGO2610302.1 hypothetical protein [Enterococcus faecalis]EGO2717857.1 hypothetical protein [Enterococcus faecalis]EGO5093980.1 hypothetical protein [Enterococcus faecalis]EGO5146572.1 hypothetical protein [Enterococcus faecalis]
MKKIGYFSCIIFFMFLVGCSNNKKENGNLLNASSFPLILTTIIEKEEDLTKGSIFFNKDKTMTLEKEYLVNPNNEDTKKTSRTEKKVYKNIKIQENKENYEITGQLDKKTKKIEFKKVDEGKRISDAEGNVYGDFGGK